MQWFCNFYFQIFCFQHTFVLFKFLYYCGHMVHLVIFSNKMLMFNIKKNEAQPLPLHSLEHYSKLIQSLMTAATTIKSCCVVLVSSTSNPSCMWSDSNSPAASLAIPDFSG